MDAVARKLAAITALCVARSACAAAEETAHSTAPPQVAIQVIDIVVVSTDRVTLGSNTMSLAAATNVIANYRDSTEVVAVHGLLQGSAPEKATSSTMAKIARMGVPLVFVEKDGEYSWRKQSGVDGVRTVRIGTDQFDYLRRLWRRGKDDAKAFPGPVLKTTVDWDTAAGTYELRRIELGFFGERVWLMHEQGKSDAEPETIGIQFKKEW